MWNKSSLGHKTWRGKKKIPLLLLFTRASIHESIDPKNSPQNLFSFGHNKCIEWWILPTIYTQKNLDLNHGLDITLVSFFIVV